MYCTFVFCRGWVCFKTTFVSLTSLPYCMPKYAVPVHSASHTCRQNKKEEKTSQPPTGEERGITIDVEKGFLTAEPFTRTRTSYERSACTTRGFLMCYETTDRYRYDTTETIQQKYRSPSHLLGHGISVLQHELHDAVVRTVLVASHER